MIAALAARVSQRLDEVAALERAQSEAGDISATVEALDAVRQQAEIAIGGFRLLRERLPPERVRSISARLADFAQTLRRSREEFGRQRRQVPILASVKSQALQISADLVEGWRGVAQSQAGPLLTLFALVERLPEMQDRLPELSSLQAQLQQRMIAPPQTTEQLVRFDTLCRRLDELLLQVQGLSPTVRAFLAKVVAGTATLADLSEDVVAWCRQGDRAGAFFVTLPKSAE